MWDARERSGHKCALVPSQNTQGETQLLFQSEEVRNINEEALLKEDEEEVVAWFAIQLTNADKSKETCLDDGKVFDVNKESLDNDLVQDCINLGVFTTTEDTQSKT
jgi:hypothetical protein